MKNLRLELKKVTDSSIVKAEDVYPKTFMYSGSSMKGLFSVGALISTIEVPLKDLTKGDVIVFNKYDQNQNDFQVVHRIASIIKDKVVTKGDNNRNIDYDYVSDENFIGKVERFERNGKIYKVMGGLKGLYWARMKYFMRRLIFRLYKKVTNISFVRTIGKMLLKNFFKNIQKIKLNSKEGLITKWVLNGRAIAQKGPEMDYFYVKKPFDLILEKEK